MEKIYFYYCYIIYNRYYIDLYHYLVEFSSLIYAKDSLHFPQRHRTPVQDHNSFGFPEILVVNNHSSNAEISGSIRWVKKISEKEMAIQSISFPSKSDRQRSLEVATNHGGQQHFPDISSHNKNTYWLIPSCGIPHIWCSHTYIFFFFNYNIVNISN